MTIPVRSALARGAEVLRDAGIESPRLDSRVLLAFALGVSPGSLLAIDEISTDRIAAYNRLVERRASREPLAYITGTREFWSLAFAVGPGVLIPRPETETLVEAALEEFRDPEFPLRVLDIGTGSGCLLAAFLSERSHAIAIGTDSSKAALAYARRNVDSHDPGGRARFVECSWCPAHEQGFDVIFCNPPYLSEREFATTAPEIRMHEPRSALVAGPDGLSAMRALGPVLARALGSSGLAFIEIGAGQRDQAVEILRASGLDVRRAIPDLSGVPRCLIVGRPGPGGA